MNQVTKQFMKTQTRDSKWRYIVELPFKEPNQQFSDILQEALFRFKGVKRRLDLDPDLHSKYVQFMRDYLKLGHMRELFPEDIDKKPLFYLPHHLVITHDVRVIFDGSFRDASGTALRGDSLLSNIRHV